MEYLIAEYDDDSFSIVVEHNSAHIAYIHVNYNYIAKLFVNCEYRRKGIGSTLLSCAEHILLTKAYTSCFLDLVPIDMHIYNVTEFYIKNGYILKLENRFVKQLK